MNTSQLLAQQFRDVYFGKNWTWSWIQEQLKDVDLQQAKATPCGNNSILKLAYHLHYYVHEVLKVLNGEELKSKDEYSWNTPEITSEEAWQDLLIKMFSEAELFAKAVEKLPHNIWDKDFTEKKYGSYFRNISGITEHCHYHLGQIVLIKKYLNSAN